jgi:hypothetical protein
VNNVLSGAQVATIWHPENNVMAKTIDKRIGRYLHETKRLATGHKSLRSRQNVKTRVAE